MSLCGDSSVQQRVSAVFVRRVTEERLMAKKRTLPDLAKAIENGIAKALRKEVKLYRFLVEKDVASDIAEQAQELCDAPCFDAYIDITDMLRGLLEDLQTRLETVSGKVDDIESELGDAANVF